MIYKILYLVKVLTVVKCVDCGNSFKVADSIQEGDLVHCPACEADYKIKVKNGKIALEESDYDSEDFGEL
jgi:predicted nucleic acid-binding Zn ribbon protein